MRPTKYLPKIGTFDGQKFWTDSFADGRAKLLRLAGVAESEIPPLVSVKYAQLSSELRYEIETSQTVREKIQTP